MGREARLKHNPARARYQAERDRAALERMRRGPGGGYLVDRHRPLEEMMQTAAMHEAGHIVSAFTLGFRVNFAVVNVEKTATHERVGGYTEHFLGAAESREAAIAVGVAPEILHKRTVQALAGPAAERALNPDARGREAGRTEDDRQAVRFAMQATGAGCSEPAVLTAYINAADEEACRLLKDAFPAVVRIANYLLQHINERVDGDVLKRVYDDVGPEGKEA